MKVQTMVSIDEMLKKQAKESFFNISEITEKGIRDKLNMVEVDSTTDKCDFCGREEPQATRKTDGLNWLCPDEKWICTYCLKEEKRKVAFAK